MNQKRNKVNHNKTQSIQISNELKQQCNLEIKKQVRNLFTKLKANILSYKLDANQSNTNTNNNQNNQNYKIISTQIQN